MEVTCYGQRVDRYEWSIFPRENPMYFVMEGSRRGTGFVVGEWEVLHGYDEIRVRHFHRAYGNTPLVVALCEMEIAAILHAIYPTNRLQEQLQQELRSCLGEESHVFRWVGWEVAALMESMSRSTFYLCEIWNHFLNCVGPSLYCTYCDLSRPDSSLEKLAGKE